MENNTKAPELLAPAGSFESLTTAIEAGADAVYLGGKRFGARRYAANFDENDLEKAVEFAHLRRVKVYVTVNTLIPDREIVKVASYLVLLREIGVDAVLIQDLGLMALAKELVPNLELHASTQMTIHNKDGAIWAAREGLKRVVLARELSLDEVTDIVHSVPEIGIEVFIHGALCYSYSGQCLLSSVIGGRSGNRGMCAQPCRKPYHLVQGSRDQFGRPSHLKTIPLQDQYLMSTKDLAVYPHLDKIAKSGVNSLKIEGRMKSPEYVSVVISIYRKALDDIFRGNWSPSDEDMEQLALAFNREFTKGHILGAKHRDLMGPKRPDNRGLEIGSVISCDKVNRVITIKLKGNFIPEKGDGIVLRSSTKDFGLVLREKTPIRNDLMQLKSQIFVEKGAKVYLTHRAALTKKVVNSRSKLNIDLDASFEENEIPSLKGMVKLNGTCICATVVGQFYMVPAIRQPLSNEQIEEQLCKTGGTQFSICKLKIDYPGGLFTPLRNLNQLRRDVLKEIESEIVKTYRPSQKEIDETRDHHAKMIQRWYIPSRVHFNTNYQEASISVYANSLQVVKGAANGGCERIYFEPMLQQILHGERKPQEILSQLEQAAKICKALKTDLIWKWPRITRHTYLNMATHILKDVSEVGVSAIMVEGMGAAQAVLAEVPDMPLFGSVGLNVWNSLTIEQLAPTFNRLTISPELSAMEISEMLDRTRLCENCPSLEIIVQGNQESMITEDDLLSTTLEHKIETNDGCFWGLKDVTNRIFPFWTNDESRTHVLNAVEMCLVDQVPHILEMGINSLAIDARCRTEKYARDMVDIYRDALDIAARNGGKNKLRENLQSLKTRAKKRSMGGITSGAFLNGRKE